MMKVRLGLFILVTCSAMSATRGQAAASSPTQAASQQGSDAGSQIPASTVIAAELSKSIDSKKAKSGDKVEARTVMDVLSHGTISIPRNSKVVGHVTEAKASSKESPGARLGLLFDRVILKDGRQLEMQAVLQALARPLHNAALGDGGFSDDNSGIPSASSGQNDDILHGVRMPSRVPAGPTSNDSDRASIDANVPPGRTTTALGPASQGVVGIKGLTLKKEEDRWVLVSEKENVHLDDGMQIVLRVK